MFDGNESLAMKNREKTILLTSKAESAARCELMMKATAAKKDGKPDLSLISQAEYDRAMYHQFQTRTIATCAEGENKFIESMCQNIYSLDDLFEVLENPKIAFEFKRPYLRFLLWVYLATSSGASNPEVTDIALEKRTWNVAVDIRERVIEIGKKDLATMAVVSPMDIVYLFEAAVPFFTYFFQRYYNRGPELDAAISDHATLTSGIFDVLLDLYEKMRKIPSFTSPKQRARLNFCLQTFISRNLVTDAQLEKYQGKPRVFSSSFSSLFISCLPPL